MNFCYDFFSGFYDSSIFNFKLLRLSIATIRKSCFIKFYKFTTNRFFMFKKWINIIKNFRKSFTIKSPLILIVMINSKMRSINKINTTSKSFKQPFKNWSFGIIQRQLNFINIINIIFRFIFINVKTTFSIYKSSKISKIFNCWFNSIFNFFKFFFMFFKNAIRFIFNNFNIINKNFIARFYKLYKCNRFSLFFNKVRLNFNSNRISIMFFKGIIIKLFMSWKNFCFSMNATFKQFFKIVQNFFVYRRYNKTINKFVFRVSKMKTSISIYITSEISKIRIFNHKNTLYKYILKSIKVTDLDSPSEMSLSDIQDVVSTLLNNDARTIQSSVEASNKFGTGPVPAAYVGLAHSKLSKTLSNMNGFLRTFEYGSTANVDQAEWGAADNVRFFLSSRGSVVPNASALGADVYNTFIMGMEAYTTISLENDNANFIYHDGRLAGGPLELNSTGAWRMSHASCITNDSWICNLKSTLAN